MDPRRLTLLRHGEAQALDSSPEDFERTLTRRGNVEAHDIAERLVHHKLVPDLVLVSPAERAWSTAEIVAAVCELDAKQVQCARELYLATPQATWKLLVRRDPALRHILICGHNPGLSQLASRFGPVPERRNLPTAGLATALWLNAQWDTLEPETASSCELYDSESPLDLC